MAGSRRGGSQGGEVRYGAEPTCTARSSARDEPGLPILHRDSSRIFRIACRRVGSARTLPRRSKGAEHEPRPSAPAARWLTPARFRRFYAERSSSSGYLPASKSRMKSARPCSMVMPFP
jgi:hypothetical protein